MSEELKKTKFKIVSTEHGYETKVLFDGKDISHLVQSIDMRVNCGEYITMQLRLTGIDVEVDTEVLNGLIDIKEGKKELEALRKKIMKDIKNK